MPHKNKQDAEKEARRLGIPISQVVKSDKGYFIAPQGIKTQSAKNAYASCRADGKGKEYCSKVAWTIEKQIKG